MKTTVDIFMEIGFYYVVKVFMYKKTPRFVYEISLDMVLRGDY